MGRRKIEIQPITQERNRSVTFLKRKNGLFKKAYELGVLCSVDVLVIILDEKPGQPGTQRLYEYSSSKVKDILKKHSKFSGEQDSKGPGDFSRGSGKGGRGKLEEDLDADGEEDEEEDEPEPPKKRQKKHEAAASTSTSTKRAPQPSTTKSLKRDRSPTSTSTHSRETSPDLRPSAPSAVPSGYLQQQHQHQHPFPQFHSPNSNIANSPSSPFDPYHPHPQYQSQSQSQSQYQSHLPFQYRPSQQTYSSPYGGKYQHPSQMYSPSYRHLFENQNPNPNPTSSSINDLLSIFEAMPPNGNGNAQSNGLSLPVGNGIENLAPSWPEHASVYQQHQRGGGSSGSSVGGSGGGSGGWLDHLSGPGGQGRRPPVGEELVGVFQGGAARRGQASTADEDLEDAEKESGSTSDSEYEPQPRRRGRGKKG